MRKRKRCFFRFRVSKGLSHGLIVCSVDIIIKILRHEVRRIDIIRLTQLVRRLARHLIGAASKDERFKIVIFCAVLHLLFQCHIWIFIRKPTKGKVIFKEEDWLVKAVFGQDVSA